MPVDTERYPIQEFMQYIFSAIHSKVYAVDIELYSIQKFMQLILSAI